MGGREGNKGNISALMKYLISSVITSSSSSCPSGYNLLLSRSVYYECHTLPTDLFATKYTHYMGMVKQIPYKWKFSRDLYFKEFRWQRVNS